jgi:colanic acid biosynthesis glycosyl transferase WcaI
MSDPHPRRVLFVAINYAPELSGTAPYTAAAAEYLADQGDDVQVLTGFPHYPNWSVPAESRRRLSRRERLEGVDVHRLRHFVPATQSAAKRAFYELTFAAHLLTHPHMESPDVVVAVVPNLVSAVSAVRIARHSGARLVVWIQDSMTAATTQSGISGGQNVARIVSSLERFVVRQANTVIVISEGFRKLVESQGAEPDKVVLIRNWSHLNPPTADRASTRLRLGWGQGEIIALHAGNMGLKQGLENLVEAGRLAAKDGASVRFVLMGEGSQRKHLERLAAGESNVVFRPAEPSDTYSDVLAAADVLLINEAVSVFDMSLPSKLTSYLLAGRPILAAVAPLGSTAHEVEQTGAGSVIESGRPDLLLQKVLALGLDPLAATARGALGRSYAERVLSSRVSLESLSAVLAPTRNGSTSRPTGYAERSDLESAVDSIGCLNPLIKPHSHT